VTLLGATLIRGGIYLLTGAISFWTKRSSVFIGVEMSIFDYTSRYPLTIYPEILQGIFTFIIPLGFISFYPASELLNTKTGICIPGDLCLWAFVAGVAVYSIATAVFKIGMRRYESSGS
jgi:ABC-2 type transport system permease protein